MGLPEYRPAKSRAEAKRRGAHKYYTGVPCKYGHIADRYTISGACVVCNKERCKAKYPGDAKPGVRTRIEKLTEDDDFKETWEE